MLLHRPKSVPGKIALLALALLLVCVACRLTLRDTYVDYIPVGDHVSNLRFTSERQTAFQPIEPALAGEYVKVRIRPTQSGEALFVLRDGSGRALSVQRYRVGRFMTVYDYDTGGFTGDSVVLAAFTAFCLAVSWIMLRAFLEARGPAFYSYSVVYYSGFSIFSMVTGLTMLILTARRLIDPSGFSMRDACSAITSASFQFMLVTAPLIVSFGIAMAFSNLVLLLHEQTKLKNILGLLVSVLLIGGEALGIWLYMRHSADARAAARLSGALEDVYATVFAYFECILAGSVICGTLAARHSPPPDRDFIIILGCWFRKNGTLPPLLRGRVDCALEFWKRQRAATGKEAVLVPSGGQGDGEIMPEADAMRRYLLDNGVEERLILTEDRSRDTYQNMAYSKVLIDAIQPGAKTAFATTNYHVFRSGVCASQAGLRAEGMGSPTRWWFWPNAFMRECAGLLVRRLWQELAVLALLVGFFRLLSVVLGG